MGCRSVELRKDGVHKVVKNFSGYATAMHTSLDAIQAAYQVAAEAAKGIEYPVLVSSKHPPKMRAELYSVTTKPCGYDASISSEQVQTILS